MTRDRGLFTFANAWGPLTFAFLFSCDGRRHAMTSANQMGLVVGAETEIVQGLPGLLKHERTGIELVLVLPGEFWQGAAPDDDTAEDLEKPRHRVRLTKPYYIGRFEVTWAQWQSVIEAGPAPPMPAGASLENIPVSGVSFHDVERFLEKTGFSLPTESQWEFACKAADEEHALGDRGNLDEVAVYRNASATAGEPLPVGSKRPNPRGLFDMLGNVSEYCRDTLQEYRLLHGPDISAPGFVAIDPIARPRFELSWAKTDIDSHVIRGGDASLPPHAARATWRGCLGSSTPDCVGFRVVWMPE